MDPTLLKYWQGEQQDVGDLIRKFRNTMVLAEVHVGTENALIEVVTIRELESNTVWFRSAVKSDLCRTDQFRILRATPTPGIYQHNKEILVVKRTAKRQWAEGTCSDNVNVVNQNQVLQSLNWDVLDAIFADPSDRILDVESLEDGCFRISQNFWVCKGNEKVELFRDFYKIGTWDLGRWYFNQKAVKLLGEELKDELNLHAKHSK